MSPRPGRSKSPPGGLPHAVAFGINASRNLIVQATGSAMVVLTGLIVFPWQLVVAWAAAMVSVATLEHQLLRVVARGGRYAARAARGGAGADRRAAGEDRAFERPRAAGGRRQLRPGHLRAAVLVGPRPAGRRLDGTDERPRGGRGAGARRRIREPRQVRLPGDHEP